VENLIFNQHPKITKTIVHIKMETMLRVASDFRANDSVVLGTSGEVIPVEIP
jgi:hypothetical protein